MPPLFCLSLAPEFRKAVVYQTCFNLRCPQGDLSVKLGHGVSGEPTHLDLIHIVLSLASLCYFSWAAQLICFLHYRMGIIPPFQLCYED